METQPDPELTDHALGSEIELLADLMEAAARCTAHLRQDEVDAALHLKPHLVQPLGGAAESAGPPGSAGSPGAPTPPMHPGNGSPAT